MMDWLMSLAHQSESPLLLALILGLVFALDPCPMLTNIAAIGYISKDITNKYRVLGNGLMYAVGRTLAYGVLAYTLMVLVQRGGSIFGVEQFIESYGQWILVVFMIVMGVLMIVVDYIPGLKIGVSAEKLQGRIGGSGWGSFLLGIVLSLAFCPTNAVIFFGMLVPLSATAVQGELAPFVFAFATALPVILVAWIISFSLQKIGTFYNSIKRIGVVVRWVVGIIFIVVGIYLAISTWITDGHHHHEGCTEHHHHEGCDHNHSIPYLFIP